MDKFDYEMKTIANQEIELPNEYINMINKTFMLKQNTIN